MKSVNKSLTPVLESAFKQSIENFARQSEENLLSDLYIHFETEDSTLRFYDDLDNELLLIQLPEVARANNNSSQLFKQLKDTVRFVLQKLEEEKFFDKEFIFMPFTVSLIDKDFVVIEELIFIDNNTLKLDGDLLLGLDKELNDFLDNLMK